jgi:hypothetical protein
MSSTGSQGRQYTIRRYNQRMARRIARRAHLESEDAMAVAFTFNNLATLIIFGVIEELGKFVPFIGTYIDLAISILSFYFHRIVLVTDENVYVYRDWPFHFPGKLLLTHRRGPDVVQLGAPSSNAFMRFIRRGQLTFQDGTIVYHGCQGPREFPRCDHGNSPPCWGPVSAGRSALMALRWRRMR